MTHVPEKSISSEQIAGELQDKQNGKQEKKEEGLCVGIDLGFTYSSIAYYNPNNTNNNVVILQHYQNCQEVLQFPS